MSEGCFEYYCIRVTEKKPIRVDNTEVIWIQKNRDYLWQNYAGKWIAVKGETLIAAGDDPDVVLDEAIAKGVEDPLISGVRKKEYQGVKLIRRT